MTNQYRLSPQAYIKIILHAAKYPHKAINGLLLASEIHNEGTVITDIIPLFHVNLSVTPFLELALEQVSIFCKETKKQVVGYYHGNDSLDSKELSPTGKQIASKVHDIWSKNNCIALLIDVAKWNKDKNSLPFIPFISHESAWKLASSPSTFLQLSSSSNLHDEFQSLFQDCTLLYDFDNHLDDVKHDWLINSQINDVIQKVVS